MWASMWAITGCSTAATWGRRVCGACAPMSPSESARPGDLIFFEKTYDTAGASHVGIYVGNNRMLHCGDVRPEGRK